jgi:hypothetical protein
MSKTFSCNLDDKPAMLCRGRCQHNWIVYTPMAAGFRCDNCRTYQQDDLKPETMAAFHDAHAVCGDRPPTP